MATPATSKCRSKLVAQRGLNGRVPSDTWWFRRLGLEPPWFLMKCSYHLCFQTELSLLTFECCFFTVDPWIFQEISIWPLLSWGKLILTHFTVCLSTKIKRSIDCDEVLQSKFGCYMTRLEELSDEHEQQRVEKEANWQLTMEGVAWYDHLCSWSHEYWIQMIQIQKSFLRFICESRLTKDPVSLFLFPASQVLREAHVRERLKKYSCLAPFGPGCQRPGTSVRRDEELGLRWFFHIKVILIDEQLPKWGKSGCHQTKVFEVFLRTSKRVWQVHECGFQSKCTPALRFLLKVLSSSTCRTSAAGSHLAVNWWFQTDQLLTYHVYIMLKKTKLTKNSGDDFWNPCNSQLEYPRFRCMEGRCRREPGSSKRSETHPWTSRCDTFVCGHGGGRDLVEYVCV